MRILAIDYGTKRVGIATTDPEQIIATALTVIHPNELLAFLKKYCATESVEGFVVGIPKRLNNTYNDIYPKVLALINDLKREFPNTFVAEIDERFTSKIAQQSILFSVSKKKDRQNKGLVDEVSAVIILQNYLESRTR